MISFQLYKKSIIFKCFKQNVLDSQSKNFFLYNVRHEKVIFLIKQY